MSLWNWGSLIPKFTRCVNRIQFCHCDETPIPAMRAKNTDTAMRIRPW